MDHLPYPASAKGRERTIVPYLCQEKYDGGPFTTYPTRTGGVPDLYLTGLFPGQFPRSHQTQLASLPKRDLESFYQTWLFFGLLHEILGSVCVAEDFIYTCEDQCGYTTAVSTSKLKPALEEWIAHVQADTETPPVTYAHVAQCLCMLHAALYVGTLGSSLDPTIKLSLASLGQTLAYAANKAFSKTYSLQNVKCPSTWCMLIDDDYWRARFLAHGWCVTEIRLILDDTLSLQTRHFLACIDKRDAERNHQYCDTQQCMVYQNDLGAYQTKHVHKGCDCQILVIDPNILSNILRNQALPLIRIRRGQTLGELSIDIVASRPESRYVALSHVWADGLGNPYANAWPRCQLSYIGQLINNLDIAAHSQDIRDLSFKEKNKGVQQEHEEEVEELLLWCDTLCCPVRPEEAKVLALQYMYQTYRNASHVLVLDASLRTIKIESSDIDEVSMRIFTSPWMRRLWTLQEGALAAVTNRLWFQLNHKVVNLREIRFNARDQFFSSIDRKGLAGDMLRRLGSFANIFLNDNSIHPRADVLKAIEALRHRSVSVLSDEPLLIGNLLGLDVAQILNGGDGTVARRMNRLWRLVPSAVHGIPRDLLFRVGPRLTEPGLRWAPATLLIEDDVSMAIQGSEKEEDQALLTLSDGLSVRLPGFRLALPPGVQGLLSPHESIKQLNNPNLLWMKDEAGSWYLIGRYLPVERDNFLTDKTLTEVISEPEELWVIHPTPDFPRPPSSTAQSIVGLIVAIKPGETAEKEGVTVKRVLAKLHVNVAPIQASFSHEVVLANEFSTRLISESPALRKLAAVKHDLDEQPLSSSSSSASTETVAFEELASEIRQITTSEEVKTATAADGKDLNISLMTDIVKTVIWGRYVCMEEKVPRSQPWCVD